MILFRKLVGGHKPNLGAARPQGVRVLIFGRHSADWMDALQPGAPVWREMPGVEQVILSASKDPEGGLPAPADGRTVVIPLMEDHITGCPPAYARLTPTAQAIGTFRNKAAFAEYARGNRLSHLCPQVYDNVEAARFPCVLKRVDLNGGVGVRVVYTETELRDCLDQAPWLGHPNLLQAYVAGERQSVAHCVCKEGRIVWHCSYAYEPAESNTVCNRGRRLQRVTETPSRLAEFESFLAPLSFTGPCSIDYKITGTGQTVVLEINPRFGGSLMRPAHVADLRAALSAIIAFAAPG